MLNIGWKDLKRAVCEVKSSYQGKIGTIIIQEMIDSGLSGVMFSINPVGILNEIVIVYGKGLGCNIVDDKVKSNTIYYNKDDKRYYTSMNDKDIELNDNTIEVLIDNILKLPRYSRKVRKADSIEQLLKVSVPHPLISFQFVSFPKPP